MKIQRNNLSVILIASALGGIALVVIQLIWMRHSWQLSEEIFNQRVSMALCATIETYDGGSLCAGSHCSMAKNSETLVLANVNHLPAGLIDKPDFRTELNKTLAFYQIDLDYQLSLSTTKQCQPDVYQTVVSLPALKGKEAYLRMSFPNKKSFILRSMNLMMFATVIILIFVTVLLLLVNWSLMKQKRLLQTNVDFFNNMAHEFRTPLSNIGLAVNMLSKKHGELKGNQLIEIIRRENKQLLHEVERVLQLAKVENGDYALEKERVSVSQLLQNAIDSLSMPIAERQATLLLEDVPNDLYIFGDKQHLGNVFRNLLDNALKYTKERPLIRISVQTDDKGVIVAVQDNGIGIPTNQREMIFEKFQRIHHGDKHAAKGFGLGLAYVKNMIELHKGFVRVSSEENRGSKFEVYLPTVSNEGLTRSDDSQTSSKYGLTTV